MSYADKQAAQSGEDLGGWIETYTGKKFWPLHPRKGVVEIEDIAHSLAMNCRYNGHCRYFYSVAEHSVLLSRYGEKEGYSDDEVMWLLLHDAAEAYVPDVPHPYKSLLNGFEEIEEEIIEVIAEEFGLPYPIPESVDKLDKNIVYDEKGYLLPSSGKNLAHNGGPLGIEIRNWTPAQAKAQFMQRYSTLSNNPVHYTFAGGNH